MIRNLVLALLAGASTYLLVSGWWLLGTWSVVATVLAVLVTRKRA